MRKPGQRRITPKQAYRPLPARLFPLLHSRGIASRSRPVQETEICTYRIWCHRYTNTRRISLPLRQKRLLLSACAANIREVAEHMISRFAWWQVFPCRPSLPFFFSSRTTSRLQAHDLSPGQPQRFFSIRDRTFSRQAFPAIICRRRWILLIQLFTGYACM